MIEIELEMAWTQREALAAIHKRMAEQQTGEAFVGLDDRRHQTTLARGKDRRNEA